MDTILGRESLRLYCVLLGSLLGATAHAADSGERGVRHLILLELKSQGDSVTATLNGMPILNAAEGGRRAFSAVVNACVRRGTNTLVVRWQRPSSTDSLKCLLSLSIKESFVNAATSKTIKEQTLTSAGGNDMGTTPPASADGFVELTRSFTLADYPVAELPWVKATGKPMSPTDEQTIRQVAMSLLRAYSDRDGARLTACYRPKTSRLAITTGLDVEKLERPQRELMDSFFADPMFSLAAAKAEELQIVPMEGLNLVRVTRPQNKPLVEIRLRKAAFKSELYLCRVGTQWEIAQ